jgi:hypothetical protein
VSLINRSPLIKKRSHETGASGSACSVRSNGRAVRVRTSRRIELTLLILDL